VSEHDQDWEDYYRALEGRPPRPLFLEALPLLPTPDPDGRPLLAIDLGCGDGTETIELLKRGWNVLAIDNHPDAIARLQAQAQREHRPRLKATTVSFRDAVLPRADLIYAGLSLPFCEPTTFHEIWRQIEAGLRPNAWSSDTYSASATAGQAKRA
jgi:SAM-dependent methyltransferase